MTRAFRIVAGVVGILLTLLQLFFVGASLAEVGGQEIHVVHNLMGLATTTVLVSVPLLLLAWRPHQVAVLRLVVAGGVASLLGGLLSGVLLSYLLTAVALPIVLLLLSPDRREVFRFGPPVVALLAIAVVGAVPAVMEAAAQGDLQGGMTQGDEHISQLHYAGMSVGYLTLILAAAWSAFPGRAARTARDLTGLAGAVLAVSFLAYPDAIGPPDTIWAIALLVLSVVYVAIAEITARRVVVVA